MQILIIGAGDIGFQLGKRLSQDKHDITIIERDPQKAKRATEQLDALVIEGHGASYSVLKQAKIQSIEIVASMTNNDEVNLTACRIAKKAGVGVTIARVRNPEFTGKDFILTHEELGTDLIIHPEKETADAVIRLIRQSSATDVIEFANGKIQLLGVRLEENSPLLRVPLKELGRKYNNPPVRIVAINRKQQTLIPGGNDILVPRDQIFVICDPDYIPQFITLTGKKDTRIENIMILGGGLIGQFIATSLEKEINTKIIENNEEKSENIAEMLPHTLIIHGDGTDYDLLASEGIVDMEAFIEVTGDDENNIIATLLARHLQVPRTIALVNKVEYLPITPTIGMDAVVSKQLLTVNAVQRYIQHQQVTSIVSLPGIDAQCIEFIAKDGLEITRKPLQDANFPKHAIVGAVMHGDDLIIPKGETQIQPGDKAVVFTRSQDLDEVEKFFN
jgi:trk system potassium uptake protein TrkA